MVDEKDADLPAVSGVDESGAVDDTDTVATGMPRPGKHESGEPLGDGHGDPRGHGGAFTRNENGVDSAVKVDRGIADMSSCGNWQFPIETYEVNLHGVLGASGGATRL